MSSVVLSSSVRQNLLSLQSTADLLSTTQSRLSTGKKVNSALDNPTNFFTAQGLDSRASDISNLLDGIGNGVQVLQAANTGITSLQKLVDSAKSIANQALQTTVGYTKSAATSASSGATAANLLGTTAAVTSSVTGSSLVNNVSQTFTATAGATGNVINDNHLGAYVAPTVTGTAVAGATSGAVALTALTSPPTAGQTLVVNSTTFTFTATGSTTSGNNISVDDTLGSLLTKIGAAAGTGGTATLSAGAITVTGDTTQSLTLGGTGIAKFGLTAATTGRTNAATAPAPITTSTLLAGAAAPGSDALATAFTASDTITINGTTINFVNGSAPANTLTNKYIDLSSATVNTLKTAIDSASGGTSTLTGGAFQLTTGTGADIAISGSAGALAKIGLPAGPTTITRTSAAATAAPITGATALKGAVGTNSLTSNFSASDTITVKDTSGNTKTLAFFDGSTGGVAGGAANTTYFDISTKTVADVLTQIDTYSGGTGSSVVGGKVQLNASSLANLDIGGTGLAKLGLTTGVTPKSTPVGAGLSGQTLSVGATGGGTATNITFGSLAGQVSNLNDLNTALAANNLQASISTTGAITLTTTNEAASYNIGAISGTATNTGNAFAGVSASATVADASSQSTRANLVAQYNQVIDNIKNTAQDSSFNGVNLLNGDSLTLTFNETGKSKLKISGVNFDPAGLGLSSLTTGTDFIDSSSTNKVLSSLSNASTSLRSQSSALGSNLSLVQIRQDFSKNLINVLQTGSSNLTLADTNEEAANSQALSTRQSIAVSALSLANQSQQSVLQLLR